MKKLLITTMAAVSVGLCAKAAEDTGFISGTSFENLTAGEQLKTGYDDDGTDDGEKFWTFEASGDDLFTVTNITDYIGSNTYPSDNRPAKWSGVVNSKALSIDTANPILRNVNQQSTQDYSYPAQPVTTPVFFDSVVQFTATDVAPSMENNTTDKLMVWLYATPEGTEGRLFGEDEAITNLVITAGYYDGDGNRSYTNYLTNVAIQPDTWHRLTIKAINDIEIHNLPTPGFEVYVDGNKNPVSGKCDYDGENPALVTKFPSLIARNNSGVNYLQGVAFDGKGAVDDIVFTTTDPFYVPPEIPKEFFLNLALSADDAAEAVLLLVKVNGETVSKNDAGVYNLALNANNIEAYVECASGYEIQGASYDSDSQCWIVPINVAGATENGTVNVTITVEKAGGSTSVKVGEVEVEFDSTGKITNITTANNGQVVTGEITDDMFADYYAVSVVDGKLVIALDPEVAEPTIGETAADKGDAIVVTETEVALGVTNAKAGLWYGAQAYSDAACTTKIGDVTGWAQAESTTVTVTATKPEGDMAFFKVVVDDQDHTPATPPEEQN